jgi:DNA-directed RNA polymerase specialized sigma24 family protein
VNKKHVVDWSFPAAVDLHGRLQASRQNTSVRDEYYDAVKYTCRQLLSVRPRARVRTNEFHADGTTGTVSVNRTRMQRMSPNDPPDDPVEDPFDTVRKAQKLTPDERKKLRRTRAQLGDIISVMPPVTSKIFVLNKICGLDHQQIASRLNMSDRTVKRHMAIAARISLRGIDQWPDEPDA